MLNSDLQVDELTQHGRETEANRVSAFEDRIQRVVEFKRRAIERATVRWESIDRRMKKFEEIASFYTEIEACQRVKNNMQILGMINNRMFCIPLFRFTDLSIASVVKGEIELEA